MAGASDGEIGLLDTLQLSSSSSAIAEDNVSTSSCDTKSLSVDPSGRNVICARGRTSRRLSAQQFETRAVSPVTVHADSCMRQYLLHDMYFGIVDHTVLDIAVMKSASKVVDDISHGQLRLR